MQQKALLEKIEDRPYAIPVLFLLVTFIFVSLPVSKIEIPHYLFIHTFMELLSVALGFMVFVVYWATKSKGVTTQGIILATSFLAVACADTFHITAFRGMPQFFKIAGTGAAIYFWFAARFFQTSSFLAVALIKNKPVSQSFFNMASLFSLSFSLLAMFYVADNMTTLPEVFTKEGGLTHFKVIIELSFSVISLVAAYLFLKKDQTNEGGIDHKRMGTSCLYFAVMGVGFCLYQNAHDFMNFWGHILKLVSYSYIYQSLIYNKIVSPYEKVDMIRKELNVKASNIKLLEAELERSRKVASLGAEVRGMAHDLNNVLMIISNSACSILRVDGVGDNEVVIKKVDQIKKATIKSQDFLRSLLNFSKNVSVEKQEIYLSQSIYDFKKLITPLLPSNITLDVQIEDDQCVFLKKTDLEQLLFNLVLNARDALEDKTGFINVRAYRSQVNEKIDFLHYHITEGEYVCLSVEDNGSGIAPENLERIFEPFFTTKENGKGTGVGLSTVVSIVQKNNGYLTVKSSPGRGTTFTLYFLNSSVAKEAEQLQVA